MNLIESLMKESREFSKNENKSSKKSPSRKKVNEASSFKHPSKREVDMSIHMHYGNPYNGKFNSEDEKEEMIKSYQKKIDAKEARLNKLADQWRSRGGYPGWHTDKDNIGYMYDRLDLMKKAKVRESKEEATSHKKVNEDTRVTDKESIEDALFQYLADHKMIPDEGTGSPEEQELLDIIDRLSDYIVRYMNK